MFKLKWDPVLPSEVTFQSCLMTFCFMGFSFSPFTRPVPHLPILDASHLFRLRNLPRLQRSFPGIIRQPPNGHGETKLFLIFWYLSHINNCLVNLIEVSHALTSCFGNWWAKSDWSFGDLQEVGFPTAILAYYISSLYHLAIVNLSSETQIKKLFLR